MAKSDEATGGAPSGKDIPAHASRLGAGLSAQADLAGREDLVLQGAFKGSIGLTGADLYVDQAAEVEAEVDASNVFIYGSLTGNVRASGRVFLAAGGRILGNITASQIAIQEGARFRGSIQMKPKDA